MEIWHIVAIEACYGTAQAFFQPAYTGIVPRTVPPGEVQQAQALSSLTLNLAELTGPAIATALVLGVGAGWAFLLDAATFVVSATLLMRVRTGAPRPPPGSAGPSWASSSDGFREVSTRPWLWVTVVVFSLAVPVGYAPLFVLGPTIAKETYDSAAVFGIVTAAYGAGALIGALVGLRWRPRHPMRAAFLVTAAWPLMLVSFAVGAPVALVVVLVGRHRDGLRAVRGALGHHDGGADPPARAVPRERLGVDGLPRPAAARLSRPARPPRPRAPRR